MLPSLRRTVVLLQTLSGLLFPHGGQAAARRNAWVGMSADAQRGRDRRAAQAALVLAVTTHQACSVRAGRLAR